MVFDDGTVLRLADDRFLVTTTTGNAAAVLDWMEEWLQTEWPHLRVRLHVGDRAVGDVRGRRPALARRRSPRVFAGPRRRQRRLRVHDLAGHRPRRRPRAASRRISFSGELAYEVNVASWYAPALWERLLAAGEPEGITPYGTETMHVLRAEKGYPIIGQDTDGTVTPHDLGLAGRCRRRSPTSSASARFARAENRDPAASSWSALLPADAATKLPEGSQIVASATTASPAAAGADARPRHVELPQRRARPPVRARAGRGRAANASARSSTCPSAPRWCPRRIAESVLVDPEGARRDG